jgi:type IV secretion system protein VirB9
MERLNFGYSIEGDRPPWRPVRAFDDGRQVFIEFPSSLPTGEAPPLFVRGEGGAAELVNYRLRGRYYVVDRLFSAAELRLGGAKQQIVRILKAGEVASRKHKGKSS